MWPFPIAVIFSIRAPQQARDSACPWRKLIAGLRLITARGGRGTGGAQIARALRAAVGRLTVFDPRVHATLLAATQAPPKPEPARSAPPPDGLTQREAEILGMIAHGMTNPEIAAQLFLSNHTVKTGPPRVFRTAILMLIHAASCRFRYSSWTSCGVL
ncbi:MAG TPA: LuxR C-terminal-related transcriptional regulator [Terriglobales bacterium]|nr:LuxR C-terminal-related transcriptional regulator [Terriglobales bacterium]